MLKFLARCAAVAASLSLLGALPAPGTASASTSSSSTSCLSDNGTDVADYFGIRGDAVWLNLQGRQPACLTVVKGNTFTRTHGWITQVGERAVYPDSYVPDHREPIVDFLSKLTQARYVISRDGHVEMTRVVRGPALFAHAKLGQFGDLFVAPDTTLVPGVTIEAESPEWTTLEPFDSRHLGVGEHTIEIYWTLSELHCDGFAADLTNNCFPAGETLSTQTAFTVVRAGP